MTTFHNVECTKVGLLCLLSTFHNIGYTNPVNTFENFTTSKGMLHLVNNTKTKRDT
jgi:hypothetical protein